MPLIFAYANISHNAAYMEYDRMRHSPDIMEIFCSVQLGKNHTKKDLCDTLLNLKVIRAVL